MAFQVVEEQLIDAREQAIASLGATRRSPVDASRFDWLYRRNPDGEAVLWAVRNGETGEMAGFTVALPRRVVVDGVVRTCWNGADFSILPKYRTLGLAMKLRRAAKEGVDAGRVDFLYAHPNERMAVVHAKVGHLPVGRMFRYARPVRIRPYLEERLFESRSAVRGSPDPARSGEVGRPAPSVKKTLARAAAGVIDPVWRLLGRETRHRASCEVCLVENARFDERYDRLFEEAADRSRIVGVRAARYLNWRYAENPLYNTHALEAREGNRLRGYLLFVVEGETANVKDIFPPGDDSAARDLIAALLRRSRELGLKSASVTTLEGNPLDPRFAEFGFRRRPESSQMFAYARCDCPWRDAVLDSASWFLTVGDRDV